MSPCLTPLLIDISSDRVPLKLTLAFIPLWRKRIRPTNLSGQPNFSNIFQRVDMLTVSKAFDKSMKHWYNRIFCSLHFSCNCRALKIISTVPRLARKPHCDSGRIPLTIVRTNLFKIILENNFPTIDSRDMLPKLQQSDFEPILYKDTAIASLQSWGTSLSHTLWMTCSWRSIIFSPPFFRISAVMPSIPGALLLFIWLTEAFISPLEGTSSRAMIVSCCLMRSNTDSSTTAWRLKSSLLCSHNRFFWSFQGGTIFWFQGSKNWFLRPLELFDYLVEQSRVFCCLCKLCFFCLLEALVLYFAHTRLCHFLKILVCFCSFHFCLVGQICWQGFSEMIAFFFQGVHQFPHNFPPTSLSTSFSEILVSWAAKSTFTLKSSHKFVPSSSIEVSAFWKMFFVSGRWENFETTIYIYIYIYIYILLLFIIVFGNSLCCVFSYIYIYIYVCVHVCVCVCVYIYIYTHTHTHTHAHTHI